MFKICYSLPTIFWQWLIWTQIDLGVSWAHVWGVFLKWYCFFFLANFAKWIYHHDISAYLGMHIFASMESFYMSAIFCFVFVLLLGTCYLSKNYWSKFSWSLGSENQFWVCSNQTLLLCLNYNYVSFNLYLFKRAIFDVK